MQTIEKWIIVFVRNLENILNRFRERMVPMAFAETFKALSDPVRREILVLLKKEKLSAGEIGKHFEMTGATISYHLKILKKADLIRETKYKNFIYYELNQATGRAMTTAMRMSRKNPLTN